MCQRAYWCWRVKAWSTRKLGACQKECTKRGLWAGGDVAEVRARLIKLDFAAQLLGVEDWACPPPHPA